MPPAEKIFKIYIFFFDLVDLTFHFHGGLRFFFGPNVINSVDG